MRIERNQLKNLDKQKWVALWPEESIKMFTKLKYIIEIMIIDK